MPADFFIQQIPNLSVLWLSMNSIWFLHGLVGVHRLPQIDVMEQHHNSELLLNRTTWMEELLKSAGKSQPPTQQDLWDDGWNHHRLARVGPSHRWGRGCYYKTMILLYR